jgi:hypothetical protein
MEILKENLPLGLGLETQQITALLVLNWMAER